MPYAENYIETDFLDVGQGDGTFIVCPDGESILVDLGSKKNAKTAGADAMTYLFNTLHQLRISRGLTNPTIDYLFITHSDGDHYNLILKLIEKFKTETYKDDKDKKPIPLVISRVLIGGPVEHYSKVFQKDFLNPMKGAKRLVLFGDEQHDTYGTPSWTFSKGKRKVEIYLLSVNVPSIKDTEPNPQSIVLLIQFAGRKMLLMGDAEKDVEQRILKWYAKNDGFLESEVLKLGHHGSVAGTSQPWLDTVKPRMVFASSDSKWAHPYCETIQRVAEDGYLWGVVEHPWLCGKGANVSKNYYNHYNNCGVYTTMAFQIPGKGSKMVDISDEDVEMLTDKVVDEDDVIDDGLVQGTQYSLSVYECETGQTQGTFHIVAEVGKMHVEAKFDTGYAADCGDVTEDATLPTFLTPQSTNVAYQSVDDLCGC